MCIHKQSLFYRSHRLLLKITITRAALLPADGVFVSKYKNATGKRVFTFAQRRNWEWFLRPGKILKLRHIHRLRVKCNFPQFHTPGDQCLSSPHVLQLLHVKRFLYSRIWNRTADFRPTLCFSLGDRVLYKKYTFLLASAVSEQVMRNITKTTKYRARRETINKRCASRTFRFHNFGRKRA